MKFTVGGESYELTREMVISAVKDLPIDTIQKHVVEIDDEVFPPKQVFGAVTGRSRQSFTTMEAQRVLSRLGFVCRPAEELDGRSRARVVTSGGTEGSPSHNERIVALETAVGTLQAAVAGLHARVRELEASHLAAGHPAVQAG